MKHDCKDELRDVDLRATPARIALMNLLETSEEPLDVQSMIDYLEGRHVKADPATVFRIMNMFTDKGITRQISFNEGKFRYELASKNDHHHLVCNKCGNIEDISDCRIGAYENNIEKQKNFKVTNHLLEFFGVCQKCQY